MYRELGEKLKDVLKLEREPVAIKWSVREPRGMKKEEGTSRFCTKLEKAMEGKIFYSTVDEEECGGGMRYSGMKDPKELPKNMQSGSFLIPAGVFKNMPALQRAWSHHPSIKPGIFSAILFAPLKDAPFEPDIVFVVCNAKQGMEILHANTYDSGAQSEGADIGPICSSMAARPYLTGRVTYGFGDIGSRNNMNIRPENVMISIPAGALSRITANIGEMKTKTFFRE